MSELSACWLIFYSDSDTYLVSSQNRGAAYEQWLYTRSVCIYSKEKRTLATRGHGTTKPLLPFGRGNAIPFLWEVFSHSYGRMHIKYCLSHDWNIIPVICGITLRVQRDPEEVSLEICAAKTQHRASKYSKDYSGISSSASNRTHSVDLFLRWLPTKTARKLIPGNTYRTLGGKHWVMGSRAEFRSHCSWTLP